MAESREDRLARIRAVVDAPAENIETGEADLRAYVAGRLAYVDIADLAWLLSQVSGDREYRVEAQYGTGWGAWEGWTTYTDRRAAGEALEAAARSMRNLPDGDEWNVPVRLASAPVQVWTPEVEA